MADPVAADIPQVRHPLAARSAVVFTAALALSGICAGVAQASDPLAYVADEQAGTISQIDLATGQAAAPIAVGSQPDAIAITPDGSTAYVADYGSSAVVPVSLATGLVHAPIALSDRPNAIAIAPNGRVAYVISDAGREWPLTLASGRLGNPTSIPTNSDAIAIAPSGQLAYITDVADATVSPFSLSGGGLGEPINLNSATPDGIAITPDGATAYVASNSGGTISPIDLATGAEGAPITVGAEPTAIAISADGGTAYVTSFGTGQITPITLATGTAGTPITVGGEPSAIALVPPSGITAGSGSGGGSTSTAGSGAPATVGNQQLTLVLSLPSAGSGTGTTGAGQLCRAPGSTLRATLKRRTLRHGARLRLRYATFAIGRRVKRVRRLPATVRFPLRGLRPGIHTLTVRAFYGERLTARAGRRSGRRRVTVTISRRLTTRFRVC